jgi:hypothetical protein
MPPVERPVSKMMVLKQTSSNPPITAINPDWVLTSKRSQMIAAAGAASALAKTIDRSLVAFLVDRGGCCFRS